MTDRKKASREEIIAAYKHQGTLASRKDEDGVCQHCHNS
jgi:hypothetical protein